MCGIFGIVAQRKVKKILIEGLHRLEYRGYDSAGIAVLESELDELKIKRIRCMGKVKMLEQKADLVELEGSIGIAHTRWATHGKPSLVNAHPHVYGEDLAVVHNGIIENYKEIKDLLIQEGYDFFTETDTEVIVNLLDKNFKKTSSVIKAVNMLSGVLHGAYAIAVIHKKDPEKIYVKRKGCPLLIGQGLEENYISSDPNALLFLTDKFYELEDGDIAVVGIEDISIYNANLKKINRKTTQFYNQGYSYDKGEYSHYMLKEIYEQPKAILSTLEDKIGSTAKISNLFFNQNLEILENIQNIYLVSCGTSYNACIVAKYWLNLIIPKINCFIETASEFRYFNHHIAPNSIFLAVSQSGETADTLAALELSKNYEDLLTISICNSPNSTLVRKSFMNIMTLAGIEIGVASTKAFTSQLVALLLLILKISYARGAKQKKIEYILKELQAIPNQIEKILNMTEEIKHIASEIAKAKSMFYIGRGLMYPIAIEAALKLKEISYIHAEAYQAGELKHGPLALIDSKMPVVVLLNHNSFVQKTVASIEEIKARNGIVILIVDYRLQKEVNPSIVDHTIIIPPVDEILSPICFSIPVQLLAYYVAEILGTDIDQPRNLAKSVTVE